METDVYVLCPWCRQIRPGKGSGELFDEIECSGCGKKIYAGCFMKDYSDPSFPNQEKAGKEFLTCKDSPSSKNAEDKGRKLYIPRNFKIDEGEFAK